MRGTWRRESETYKHHTGAWRFKALSAGRTRITVPQTIERGWHHERSRRCLRNHGSRPTVADNDRGCLFYTKGRYGHYAQNRAISIREAARLQTFPDDYIFSDSLTSSALQIGNAVPIDLVKASGSVLHRAIYLVKEHRSRVRNGARHA